MSKEKDSLVRFEKKFPLYKMHVSAWIKKLQDIGKENIEIDYLKGIFTSESFKGTFEPGQPLHTILSSLPGTKDNVVTMESLSLLGVAWCGGELQDKA